MPSLIVDTAVVVSVGPLIDDTDFKTLEESIAYNAAGMAVDLFKSTGAAVTKVDLTLTTGGANDWTHKGNGVYELEISAAQNDTEGELWVAGKCTGVLVFESPHYNIVTENVYNSLVGGTDNLEVEVAAAQLGTLRDLGDGATLSGMLSSLAGKTSNAASYDRATDSQEALRDNQGSGGLTAQQTRDAMKLAPSAGAADVGSIDDKFEKVNVLKIGGSEQSATDLKDFADAGYDPATHKVEGVKTVDTTTTNTDMLTIASILAAAVEGTTTVQDALARMSAYAAGKLGVVDNEDGTFTLTYYGDDDTTAIYALTATPADGTRVQA